MIHPANIVSKPMGSVNPWRRLREMSEVQLKWKLLPAGVRGVYEVAADGPTITLDARLNRVQRNATLLHEEIHHERGITGDPRTDERGVADEAARLLVPFDELHALWEVAVLNDLPVEVWMVAEKFEVPDDVAERAMRLFLGRGAA